MTYEIPAKADIYTFCQNSPAYVYKFKGFKGTTDK